MCHSISRSPGTSSSLVRSMNTEAPRAPLSYTSTAGFPELHMSRVINADFDTAADRLFRWGVQRSGLFRVHPTHEVVETGAEVALSLIHI